MTGKVTSVKIEYISLGEKRRQPKLVLSVDTGNDKKPFDISEAFVTNTSGEIECRGCWVNTTKDGHLTKHSTLNKVMQYLNCETIEDFNGKEVTLKKNGKYFALYCTGA